MCTLLSESSSNRGFAMDILRRKYPKHFVPIHRDNVSSSDWVIVLEAGTIVGASPRRLRVAKATLERKVVRKFDIFFGTQHFLVLEGYNPRIHAIYFCPQLYRYDSDKKLIPLEGEEIGQLIAASVESGVAERQPWYEPVQELPVQPIIGARAVVLELPPPRSTPTRMENDGSLAETDVLFDSPGPELAPGTTQTQELNGDRKP
jgi:hypothetical protein